MSCTFQLIGGSSCERRKVHCTMIDCSCHIELPGRIIFSATPNQINLGGHLPSACSAHSCIRQGLLLHREECPLHLNLPDNLLASMKCVWRNSPGTAPAMPLVLLHTSSLHFHSAELLPSLHPILFRSGNSCCMVCHLQEMYFCCHFLLYHLRTISPSTPIGGLCCMSPGTAHALTSSAFGSPNSFGTGPLGMFSDFTAPGPDGVHTVHGL